MARDSRTGLAIALAVAAMLRFGPATAEERPRPVGVVELFTSQGCNSCPPADALFGELAARKDLVTLAYHVDYWDYLGWRDTLARPENTERQRDYGKALGLRSVYTPQAVINGRMHVNGAKRAKVAGAIEAQSRAGEGPVVELKARREGDIFVIEAGPAPTKARAKAHLVLVFYDAAQPVEIGRGENAGATIIYRNPVTDLQTAGMWHGKPARFELPASEIDRKGGCAVLLQAVDRHGLPGPILGALILREPDVAAAQ
jgi:hypothetical protein